MLRQPKITVTELTTHCAHYLESHTASPRASHHFFFGLKNSIKNPIISK